MSPAADRSYLLMLLMFLTLGNMSNLVSKLNRFAPA